MATMKKPSDGAFALLTLLALPVFALSCSAKPAAAKGEEAELDLVYDAIGEAADRFSGR